MEANPILEKNKVAGTGGTTKFRIVKRGAADGEVVLATASTEAYLGIVQETVVAGIRCRVMKYGISEVEFGGTVTEGQRLTSDSTGRAVAAAPGAGVNASIIGVAEVSGVVGDIGECTLNLGGIMQG